MRAAVVEEPGKITVKEVPEPVPSEYQALCETLYGAMCTGTDAHLLRGDDPFGKWVRYPMIIGHESIGRVVEVGSKVRSFRVGDLITRVGTPPVGSYDVGWGGFAEYGIAGDWQAMKEDGVPESQWRNFTVNWTLPQSVDPAEATMFITWRETLSYCKRMNITKGSSVVVVGSGGNGLSFAAHAANLGADPVVMIGSRRREAEAKKVGSRVCIDYRDGDAGSAALEVSKRGYDFAIDAVGNETSAKLALSLVADCGELAVYGMDASGRITLDPRGGRGTFTVNNRGYAESETHADIVSYYLSKKLDASVWLNLDSPFPLEDIADAFEAAKERRLVKPLVRISDKRA